MLSWIITKFFLIFHIFCLLGYYRLRILFKNQNIFIYRLRILFKNQNAYGTILWVTKLRLTVAACYTSYHNILSEKLSKDAHLLKTLYQKKKKK